MNVFTGSAPDNREKLFSLGKVTVHKPRGPRRYFNEITAGYALYPLIILFGLNAVDELDRTVFGVLGPEIRDHFGLTNQGYLSLIALTLLGGLLLEIPLAFYADRLPRARIAVLGAAVWMFFGVFTGMATTILLLVIARSGAGMGRAVVTPTHNSLLADYYPIEVRADVYGFHRMANAVGAVRRPARRRHRRRSVRLARAVLHLRHTDARVRDPRPQAEGTRPWPLRTPGRRGRRGGRRDRRRAAVVGRVGAHPLAGADAAPHLVLAAVPRRVGDRSGLAHLASTTRRSSTSRNRNGASSPPSPSPRRSSASCSGSRSPRA